MYIHAYVHAYTYTYINIYKWCDFVVWRPCFYRPVPLGDFELRQAFTPQPEVLAHPAVKMFLSHCGWGGVTETWPSWIKLGWRQILGDSSEISMSKFKMQTQSQNAYLKSWPAQRGTTGIVLCFIILSLYVAVVILFSPRSPRTASQQVFRPWPIHLSRTRRAMHSACAMQATDRADWAAWCWLTGEKRPGLLGIHKKLGVQLSTNQYKWDDRKEICFVVAFDVSSL